MGRLGVRAGMEGVRQGALLYSAGHCSTACNAVSRHLYEANMVGKKGCRGGPNWWHGGWQSVLGAGRKGPTSAVHLSECQAS